ncbi:MAG: DegT/DnrJ/EryC1/StrS family aminotransferase [candidate division Zixibacteria bacterium]|nr:DegT/DnrJ/EryC1/StrS family aminotransferase [candidate division Zixibacteria bacterium]
MRETFLPFASPCIGEDEIAEVVDTLRAGWLTSGPKVRQFEREFAARVGSRHAVAVNSCTAALHLALEAIGIRRGDEVITTPFTFAATGEVIHYLGARPVFVDIDPVTLNMDPDLLAAAANDHPRARAVIPVHIAGVPCAMDEILEIAGRHGLKVIEDAAHAFPSRYHGRMIGTLGDITCFSFYATKTITTGEGGMATTDDEQLAERMRMMSLHGISSNAWTRYEAHGTWRYEIHHPGFKYNMPELAAALGRAQLRRADDFLSRRRAIAARYTQAFTEMADCLDTPPDAPADGQHSWHLYIIRLKPDRLRIGRDEFIEEMRRMNIGTSVHFIPLHLHPYYRATYGYEPHDFPRASETFERIISLPIYPGMTDRDVESVIEAVAALCERHAVAG